MCRNSKYTSFVTCPEGDGSQNEDLSLSSSVLRSTFQGRLLRQAETSSTKLDSKNSNPFLNYQT